MQMHLSVILICLKYFQNDLRVGSRVTLWLSWFTHFSYTQLTINAPWESDSPKIESNILHILNDLHQTKKDYINIFFHSLKSIKYLKVHLFLMHVCF